REGAAHPRQARPWRDRRGPATCRRRALPTAREAEKNRLEETPLPGCWSAPARARQRRVARAPYSGRREHSRPAAAPLPFSAPAVRRRNRTPTARGSERSGQPGRLPFVEHPLERHWIFLEAGDAFETR